MSGRVPVWLADWLGISPSPGADGAMWQLESAWRLAPWATVLLVLAVNLWAIMLYTRESTSAGRWYRGLLAALRIAAVAMVLVMLAQFALAVRLTGPASIAVVIDRSASMGIADRYADSQLVARLKEQLGRNGFEDLTRLNLAKLLLTGHDGRLLKQLADNNRLEVYFAAAGLERQAPSVDSAVLVEAVRGLSADGPDSRATRLGDAVRQILNNARGAPPAAVILLTDGVTTEGVPLVDAAQDARREGVPIFAVGLGSTEPPRDIELADVLVDEVVFVNDPVSFQVQVKATGLEGQSARITLRREADQSPLAEEDVTLPAAGQTVTVRLLDRPTQAGDVAYLVEIAARDDETNKDNNRQRRVMSVRDEKINVLIVQAYPNYEFRFLKTLLERDPTITLATYLQDSDPEYAAGDKTALTAFPVGRDELFAYDVLVIGDVDPRLLPQSVWKNVRAFVSEKGGGVAMIAGPRYLPSMHHDNADVAALLPVDLSAVDASPDSELPDDITRGFVVRPTPLGLQHPALQLGLSPAETAEIWRHLPPLYWLFPVGGLKPAAQVLAEQRAGSLAHTESAIRNPQAAVPVICFQYVGAGRVLFHAIDSTWRWRLGGGEKFFARYWVQTILFLARGKLLAGRGVQLAADRREYRRVEFVTFRVRFVDQRLAPAGNDAIVILEAAGQPRRRITLRRTPSAEGTFEASLTDLAEGRYQAVLATPQVPGNAPAVHFSIVEPLGEMARTEMDAATLAAAAETTRGKFYTVADADRMIAALPTGRRVPIENLPPIEIWNRWWLVAAFLGCITAEWILRKRKGML